MKINLLLFFISAVIAFGVGGYVLFKYNTQSNVVSKPPDRTMTDVAFEYLSDTQLITGTATLLTLQSIGKDIECSFEFSESEIFSEGTGFFTAGKTRIDAQSKGLARESFVSKLIITGETTYVWKEAETGLFAEQVFTIETDTSQTQDSQYITIDESVAYTCRPWVVDGSVFVPPTE